MIQAERCVYIRFRFQVVAMTTVSLVDLCEHRLVGSLKFKPGDITLLANYG